MRASRLEREERRFHNVSLDDTFGVNSAEEPLAGGVRHGHAIKQNVEERRDGTIPKLRKGLA